MSTRHSSNRWVVFALVGIAQFMVVLDTAIISVALPVMKAYLNVDDSSVQWLVTAYVLTFGGCLLLGGRVGDLFGRRRTLLAGVAGFTFFSLLIGLSTSLPELIVFRALQGVSAAMMAPSALSIVIVTFTDMRERGKALGFWSMIATGGAAVGLLLGGILTQYVSWRWNFFINVPVGVIVGAAVVRWVPPHSPGHQHSKLDLPGAFLVTVGLMAGVLGFSEAGTWGWASPGTIASLAGAVVLLLGFVYWELHAAQPLMDLSIFQLRNVTGANLIMGAVYGGNLGMFFVLTLWMQDVQGWDAIQTGLAFAPFPVVLGTMSTQMGGLTHKFGYRQFLIMGPTIIALGMLWVCRLPVHGSYVQSLLPALLVMGLGYGMTFAPVYAAATGGLDARLAGAASGLVSSSQQVGGAVGMAILTAVATAVTTSRTGVSSLQAVTDGYNAGMGTAVGLTVIALVLAIVVVKRPNPQTVAEVEAKIETAEAEV